MEKSILKSTKKILGVDPENDAFDLDILTHINSALSTLVQDLGVGPSDGLVVEDETPVWDDFIEDVNMQSRVKEYVYYRAKMAFDPPQTSYLVTSYEKLLEEVEWRISLNREVKDWTDPDPEVVTP